MRRAEELVTALQGVPLFAGVRDRDLKTLAKALAERTYEAGSSVVTEGEGAAGFFLIEDGVASVRKGGDEIRRLGPGDWFGELALIDGGPRTASIVAETDLRCRGIAIWEFRAFVKSNSEVAWAMLETLVERIRSREL